MDALGRVGELVVGMGQMLVAGGDVEGNLRRAQAMVAQAAAADCTAVVLPECLNIGWTHPASRALAAPIPGPHSDVLCRAARDAGLHVVAGLAERDGEHVYNAAILISDTGDILLKHRKINELDIAHDIYALGRSLAVAQTRIGQVGLAICADNFPDSLALGHSLCRMGADLLLSPCAWAVDADHDQRAHPYGDLWRTAYTSLARLYDVGVVGVSNVGWLTAGVWRGRKCIGCSLAVGPGGAVLAEGPYGEDAEALVPVRLPLAERPAKGTAVAQELRRRGYDGP